MTDDTREPRTAAVTGGVIGALAGVARAYESEAARLESLEAKADARDANGLLPCPFCGSAPLFCEANGGYQDAYVECVDQRCANASATGRDLETATKTWNTRAHAEPKAAELTDHDHENIGCVGTSRAWPDLPEPGELIAASRQFVAALEACDPPLTITRKARP